MKDKIHEIPDHLKPYLRFARHPDGSKERFSQSVAANGNRRPHEEFNLKRDHINPIRRAKGLPEVE